MRRLTAVLIVAVVLGAITVVVPNSPYSPTVHQDRNPFAPDRPTTVDRTTATEYIVNYEETRLYNDLLGSRSYTIDDGDTVRVNCTATSVDQTATNEFHVSLRCRGAIEDVYRVVQPASYSYTATYAMSNESVEELSVEGYPFSSRDELRLGPTSAE